MKKLLLIGLVPGLVFAQQAAAEPEEMSAWKQGATVVGGSLLGAAVAGPLGMVAGLVSGTWMGEQLHRSERLDGVTAEREQIAARHALQEEEIERLERQLNDLGTALASRLEFQVMFGTGKDELQAEDMERLKMLARYLLRNDELQVRLDGYADPRGTDEYNNVLAMYRAQNVAAALNQLGVPKGRISLHHHGASAPADGSRSLDAFALQRRVDIEVYQPQSGGDELAMDP